MNNRLSRNLKAFVPTRGPLVLSLVMLGVLLLSCPCSLLFGISSPAINEKISNTAFPLWMATSLGAFVLEVAGLWERRPPAKFALGLTAFLLVAVSTIMLGFGVGLAETEDSPPSLLMGATSALLCGTPFLALFAILPIYALIKTPAALRERELTQHEELACDLIESRGAVSYAKLAQHLNIPKEKVDRLLRRLLDEGCIEGIREVEHEYFFTTEVRARKLRQLPAIVNSRGQISLFELGEELNVPGALVEDWIYELVKQGKFSGYINWQKEEVYSAEAEKLREAGQCPSCQGELGLAGKGVIRCVHCGTEVLLEA
jgi:DNA-binding MarR family transcriptional regulator